MGYDDDDEDNKRKDTSDPRDEMVLKVRRPLVVTLTAPCPILSLFIFPLPSDPRDEMVLKVRRPLVVTPTAPSHFTHSLRLLPLHPSQPLYIIGHRSSVIDQLSR